MTDFVKGGAQENQPPRGGHIIVSRKRKVRGKEKLRKKDSYRNRKICEREGYAKYTC
jgi:hypothetical protein